MWIHSWLCGSLASYLLPVSGSMPTALEWILTRMSATFAVSRLEAKATIEK